MHNATRCKMSCFKLLVCLVCGLTGSASWALGTNVIANGNAEGGTTSWTAIGPFETHPYDFSGDWPSPADPGPPVRGTSLFAGGAITGITTATQLMNLSADATQIDAGAITFQLSGYLGGYGTEHDNARLTVELQNGGGTALATATIGPVTAADRADVTGLFLRSATGAVPVGTRQALLTLTMTYVDGVYNDGYSDNLSLVLNGPTAAATAVPVDNAWALAAVALLLAAFGGVYMRRQA